MRASTLKRNVVYNAAGAVLPLVLSLAFVPLFLGKIGEARYGIVALTWLLFGYFGLFDLGLAQATANRMARPENRQPERQAELFWTALLINTCLGVLGGLVFLGTAEAILGRLVISDSILKSELAAAMPWIACLLPLSTINAVFVGALESKERFAEVNIWQFFGSTLGQVCPLVAIYQLGVSIEIMMAATCAARVIAIAPIAWLAFRQSSSAKSLGFKLSTVRDLFSYGGWITATNLISPILVSADQFLIGSVLGAGAVPHYSIPFNLATKALIIPGALTRALFPQLSGANPADALERGRRATSAVAMSLALVCVPAMLLAEHALHLWLGKGFSAQASTVTRLILLGVWLNGIAFIPYTLLQSQGRPDIPAKLHWLELLPFLALLWFSLKWFGLPGAAIAWNVRVATDGLLLFWIARFPIRELLRVLTPHLCMLTTALFSSLWLELSPWASLAVAAVSVMAIGFYAYKTDETMHRLFRSLMSRYISR